MRVTESASSSSSSPAELRAKIRELLEDPDAPIDPADPDRELLEHSVARVSYAGADAVIPLVYPWASDAELADLEPHGCHTGPEGPCSRCADLAELAGDDVDRGPAVEEGRELPGRLGIDLYDGLPTPTRAPWEDEGTRGAYRRT